MPIVVAISIKILLDDNNIIWPGTVQSIRNNDNITEIILLSHI